MSFSDPTSSRNSPTVSLTSERCSSTRQNFAFFENDPARPLSVLERNLEAFQDNQEGRSSTATGIFVQEDGRVEITSNGGSDEAEIVIDENTTPVTIVTATGEGEIVFGIADGPDADFFTIGSRSGDLAFRDPPNFEDPRDAGRDNVYDVTVSATSGEAADFQDLHVRVADVPGNVTPVFGGFLVEPGEP